MEYWNDPQVSFNSPLVIFFISIAPARSGDDWMVLTFLKVSFQSPAVDDFCHFFMKWSRVWGFGERPTATDNNIPKMIHNSVV